MKEQVAASHLSIEAFSLQHMQGLAWPIFYFRGLDAVATKFGVDSAKLRLHQAIENITGDDGNCFMPPDEKFSKVERGYISRRSYLMRLRWEIETPGMPADIVRELITLQQSLINSSWNTGGRESIESDLYEATRLRIRFLAQNSTEIAEATSYAGSFDWEEIRKIQEEVNNYGEEHPEIIDLSDYIQ